MTTPEGTFAPAPGRAPVQQMIVAHGLLETRLLLRNGEQLLLALVIPLVLLVAGALAPGIDIAGKTTGDRLGVLTPGVLALTIMSTSFTSLAIATAFERRYDVLKRLGASPLTRTGLLAGKLIAIGLVELLQVVLVVAVALALGWQPGSDPASIPVAALLLVAGTWAFVPLGLLLAGTVRAEAVLAAANGIYLVLVAGGATLLPVDAYPRVLQPLIGFLPSGALAEGLRETLSAGPVAWGDVAGHVVVLLAWALAAGLVTARTFRWH